MAKFGVVLVSHSEYIAKGLKELVDEMNDGSVQVAQTEEESEQVQSRFRELLNL